MTSINTNLSSLIVQKNLTKSTSALNQAIERLTTGYKINHASDNAANYSISESMTSKLSSYMVAEENTSMGLDLIRTQLSTLDTIQNLTTRLRALAEQAHNGTYGAQSLSAINQEANAIISEIERIGNNAEYNGIKLFDNALSQAGVSQLKSNGLMQEVERRDTSGMTKLADVDENAPLAAGTYSISSAEELAKLATMQNNGNITAGSEFVLGADIDLSAYSEGWISIGNSLNSAFRCTFDGNGYTISNLSIKTNMLASIGNLGLFAYTSDAAIENLVISNSNIESSGSVKELGCLAGYVSNSEINNCSIINCSITNDYNSASGLAGLLVGRIMEGSVSVTKCYTSGSISGEQNAGGVVGAISSSNKRITDCFSEAIIHDCDKVGGIVGYNQGNIEIENSGFSGILHGVESVGGIIGKQAYLRNCENNVSLNNVVFTGNVSVEEDGVCGMLIGNTRMKDGALLTIRAMYDSTISNAADMLGELESDVESDISFMDMASQLQVGVDSTDSSIIKFTTNISLSSINSLRGGMESANSLESIDSFISKLSESQTRLGAIENRLTSTIESIGVNIENLTSSRSTLKDADVAKESSQLLKNQILQQAAATLLSTANQTPSLALRLLNGM